MRYGQRIPTGTHTADRFQKVQNILVVDDELSKPHKLLIRPAAFSLKEIGQSHVVNNLIRPCIHKIHAVLELKGGNNGFQRVHPVYK